jgi:hypothetical protein
VAGLEAILATGTARSAVAAGDADRAAAALGSLRALAEQVRSSGEELSRISDSMTEAADTTATRISTVGAGAADVGGRRGHDGRARRVRDGAEAGHLLDGDRQRHQGHHVHRRADQPAGPQRFDRGRPGRRVRQGQQDTGGAVEKMAAFEEVAGVAGSTRNGAKAARDSAHELGRTAHALSSLVSTIRY